LPFGDFAIMGNPPQLKIVQRKNNCLIQGVEGCGTNVLFSLEQKKSPHLKIKKKVGGGITKKPA
jgi:hypothetical protein